MKTMAIDGRLKVKTLKQNFKDTFGGTLRVYNGTKKADDDVTLASVRTNDTASGELTVDGGMTVGEFCNKMNETFGISVKVGSPDDWVIALDDFVLDNVRFIPKNSTKDKMQKLLDTQRAEQEKAAQLKKLVFDGGQTVGELKQAFRDAFGGTLRVYNGNKKAADDATLESISIAGGVNGQAEYVETMTVGEFCAAMTNDCGLSVKVGSPDDWVIALDEYTLATVRDIPKNATKAKMQALLDSQYAADDKEIEEAVADYTLDTSAYQPSKASAIFGEYIINVKQDDKVEVFRIYDNVRESLRECAEAVGFKYDPNWNTRVFGRTMLRAYGGDKQATVGNFTIVEQASGSIETYRTYGDIKGALGEIAAKAGFTLDPALDVTTAGTRLVEFINSNK